MSSGYRLPGMPGAVAVALPDGVFAAYAPTGAVKTPEGPAGDTGRGLPRWRVTERVAARRLLTALVGAVAPAGTGHLSVGSRAGGQPYLPGRPDLEVSLAHSGAVVAAAVHTRGGAVGVDVQEPYPVGDALVRRCCPQDAATLLRHDRPTRDTTVARVWTVQESCAKATGHGLGLRPWRIPVGADQEHGCWRHLRWRTLPPTGGTPWSCAWEPIDDRKGATP
ncbi:4'-phosphopantetheinyl transferase family protein [Verrucosispora sp. TAA-831]|uniref:4'-phosphopantetheinyl transferase family protein n=1 Tax=Verrucosispora sp. TAA-831 TaxID=3422227 RepID=UPI003D6DCEEB